VARRPAWLTAELRTAVPAGLSAALTAAFWLHGPGQNVFAPGEAAILLCLLLIAVRGCRPGWVAGCAVLATMYVRDTPATVVSLCRGRSSEPAKCEGLARRHPYRHGGRRTALTGSDPP
jgi:hypothetical protein